MQAELTVVTTDCREGEGEGLQHPGGEGEGLQHPEGEGEGLQQPGGGNRQRNV